MAKFINARLRQPRDTEENWNSKEDLVLLNGERVFVDVYDENGNLETKEKVGDGKTIFKELSYYSSGSSGSLISSEDLDLEKDPIIEKNQVILMPNTVNIEGVEEDGTTLIERTKTFYSAKVGDGESSLSETTYLSNLKAGKGWGSVVQVEATTEESMNPAGTKYITPSATGQRAVALGKYTVADGDASMAVNYDTQATGVKSFAINSANKATNTAAFASGHKTEANGAYSASFGLLTKTFGSGAIAGGKATQANGDFSLAFGYKNQTNSKYQTAIGQLNEPINNALFIIGNGTETTNPDGTITENHSNLLIANSKSVQINGTLCLGNTNLTEEIIAKEKDIQSAIKINKPNNTGTAISFMNSTAEGSGCFAGGIGSKATNSSSIAYGQSVETNNNYQAVFGIYNNPVSTDVFQVGYGRIKDSIVEKKNILSMNRTGVLTIQPSVAEAEKGSEATLKLENVALTSTKLQELIDSYTDQELDKAFNDINEDINNLNQKVLIGSIDDIPTTLQEGQIYFGY